MREGGREREVGGKRQRENHKGIYFSAKYLQIRNSHIPKKKKIIHSDQVGFNLRNTMMAYHIPNNKCKILINRLIDKNCVVISVDAANRL